MCSEIIIGIATIVGVLIGLIPFFIERKDRYKFEQYRNELEKRLEEFKKDLEIKYDVKIKAHQEAFSWLMNLNVALNSNVDEMNKTASEAREWWNRNCFFLDKETRENFMALTNWAHQYARMIARNETGEHAAKVYSETWGLLRKTIESVQKGIKVEKLDVLERPEDKDKKQS